MPVVSEAVARWTDVWPSGFDDHVGRLVDLAMTQAPANLDQERYWRFPIATCLNDGKLTAWLEHPELGDKAAGRAWLTHKVFACLLHHAGAGVVMQSMAGVLRASSSVRVAATIGCDRPDLLEDVWSAVAQWLFYSLGKAERQPSWSDVEDETREPDDPSLPAGSSLDEQDPAGPVIVSTLATLALLAFGVCVSDARPAGTGSHPVVAGCVPRPHGKSRALGAEGR